MKYVLSHKLLFAGLLLIVIGGTFILLEQIFYQNIDQQDILRESLFLPLGTMSLLIGALLFALSLMIVIYKFMRQRFKKT